MFSILYQCGTATCELMIAFSLWGNPPQKINNHAGALAEGTAGTKQTCSATGKQLLPLNFTGNNDFSELGQGISCIFLLLFCFSICAWYKEVVFKGYTFQILLTISMRKSTLYCLAHMGRAVWKRGAAANKLILKREFSSVLFLLWTPICWSRGWKKWLISVERPVGGSSYRIFSRSAKVRVSSGQVMWLLLADRWAQVAISLRWRSCCCFGSSDYPRGGGNKNNMLCARRWCVLFLAVPRSRISTSERDGVNAKMEQTWIWSSITWK